MTLINRIRGAKAKREGSQFESLVERSAFHQAILPVRMPLGCRRVGRNKLFQIKTPFDFVLVYNGVSIFLDCKSYDSDRISHSQLTEHQITSLHDLEEHGVFAGYLVWFREVNTVGFATASQLVSLEPGKSLSCLSCLSLGTIEHFNLLFLFEYWRNACKTNSPKALLLAE